MLKTDSCSNNTYNSVVNYIDFFCIFVVKIQS